jgi:hypothetical protein
MAANTIDIALITDYTKNLTLLKSSKLYCLCYMGHTRKNLVYATLNIFSLHLFFRCAASRLAASSLVTRIYFMKAFSVLCPVIFIISITGYPSKYRFVAKLLRAVWEVTHWYKGLLKSVDSLPVSFSSAN